MHKPESFQEKETHEILWDFEIQKIHQISIRRPGLVLTNVEITRHLVNFVILSDHKVKIKVTEKIDKCLDLARELKKLGNMKVSVIPNVDRVLGAVLKNLEKWLAELKMRGRIETKQTKIS